MESIAIALPVRSGKIEEARRLSDEIRSHRSGESSGTGSHYSVTREEWYLQQGPKGDMLVGFMEGENLHRTFERVEDDESDFMRWFKGRLLDITGLDFGSGFRMPEPLYRRGDSAQSRSARAA